MADDLTPPTTQEQTQSTGIIQSQLTPGQTMESPTVYQPQPYEASQNELVSAQVSRLLGENSKYLQQNRTQAQQAAHARGLGNTAMAAGWGQEAAIKSALPIAQQDAGYFQSRGLEDQKGIISSHLQQQQGAIESALQNQGTQDTAYLYGQQAGYESQLQQQAAEQQSALQAQIDQAKSVLQSEAATQAEKLQAQTDLAAAERQQAEIVAEKDLLLTDIASQEKQQQATIAANKELQAQQDAAYMERLQVEISARSDLQAEQNAAEALRQEVEVAAQQKLAELEFDRETQVQLTESMGTLSQQFQRETAEILTNPDFKTAADRNKALQSSAKAYQDSVNLMASLSGVKVTWPTNFTTNTQTTSQAGTTTGTGTTTTTDPKAPVMTEYQIRMANLNRTVTKDSVPPAGYKVVPHRFGLSTYYTFEKA